MKLKQILTLLLVSIATSNNAHLPSPKYISKRNIPLSDYFNAKVLKKVDEWMKFHDFFVILQKILYHQDYGHSKNQG